MGYTTGMAKISIFVPDEALALIDSVAENRSAFMVDAAVQAAKAKEREAIDLEIAQWCARNAKADASVEEEFERTLLDGLE